LRIISCVNVPRWAAEVAGAPWFVEHCRAGLTA
jgi:hypothetical protein